MFMLQVFPEILHEVQSELPQKRRKSAGYATFPSTTCTVFTQTHC